MSADTSTPSSGTPAKPSLPWAKLIGIAVVVVGIVGGARVAFQSSEPMEAPVDAAPVLPPISEVKPKAEAGDAQAQNTLGEILAEGKQTKRDFKEAIVWYRKSADQGNARAQYHLGSLYEIGQGVPRDEAEAAKWYRKAAEAGMSDAQYNLAGMYGLGRGVPYNPKEALAWYQKAAAQGDALARYNLAERYERGRDVDTDVVEAFKWHTLAAERGLRDGEVGAANLKKHMTSEQISDAKKRIEVYKNLINSAAAAKPGAK